jgi:hypothetical protein
MSDLELIQALINYEPLVCQGTGNPPKLNILSKTMLKFPTIE